MFGITILTVMGIWVAKEGVILERVNIRLIISATLISLVLNFLNAFTLRTIAKTYGGTLGYSNALHISALGSFANAAGGFPFGTALRYVVLRKQSALSIPQITAGLIAFTLGISIVLICYAAISVVGTDLQIVVKALPVALLTVSVLTLWFFARYARHKQTLQSILNPLLCQTSLMRIMVISFATATFFIVNYLVIGYFIFPTLSLPNKIFISSMGILMGLGSLIQTVGGIQEISMAFSATLTGAGAIDGVQLALIMRITSVISSGLILIPFYVALRKHRSIDHHA